MEIVTLSESPYFQIKNVKKLNSVNDLLELNKKVSNGSLELPVNPYYDLRVNVEPYNYTSGLFRGQNQDWPLIPSSYRKIRPHKNETLTDGYSGNAGSSSN